MQNKYKVIISNKKLYKEIELLPDMKELRLGTRTNCEIRLHKAFFFEAIEIVFHNQNGNWQISCGDNLFFSFKGDVKKQLRMQLSHGDSVAVCYQKYNQELFSIDFYIDFESNCKEYRRGICVNQCTSLRIGTLPNSQIILGSQYVEEESIHLLKNGNDFWLEVNKTTYGIFHNGRLANNGELIRSGDFFSISDFFFYYKDGVLWTECRKDMNINGLSWKDIPSRNKYPLFYRNTRIKTVINEDKIEILDPPEKAEKPKNNLFMRLLPSLGMLIAAGVMAMGGGRMIVFSLISGVMAIVTAVLNLRQEKKDYKEKMEQRTVQYHDYIQKKREEIENCRNTEQIQLEQIYISEALEGNLLEQFSPLLFDRTSADEDFLTVRLGTGRIKARREIDYKKQEKLEPEDELQMIPKNLCEEYEYLNAAPVICDLKEANAVGIIGKLANRYELFKAVVMDLVIRQYHTDVKMFFVAEKEHREHISWLRMLPHVYNNQIHVRNIVCDDESKNLIFEYLYKELSIREQVEAERERLIVFFYDRYGFNAHPISRFTNRAKELGVTFVFFGEQEGDIPQGCDYLIRTVSNQEGMLINTADGENVTSFTYTPISDQYMAHVVEMLAPVYTEEISLEGSLTKNYSLYEMLRIIAADDLDLEARWRNTHVEKSMAAPLGISKSSEIELDLHDKAHGPHGLVAGTTGSGKSEILQTYILSMATLYHPYEVGFVIIDFKGGGMVNQFKNLPHLVGAITNIDGKAIERSLKSIRAELQKRERYFSMANVNHIDKYIKKYKAGEVEEPLPHLIIIVDEFAELRAAQPEFMKELISAARIGRSLGVHLILATQKPSGQVDEQIWSNSRFKLCLKVQSQQDSNEVLKSPLAAEIKEPGRAYLQVGNNEIFELFQSAYSGMPDKMDENSVKEFTIYELNESGKRIPVYQQKKKKTDAEASGSNGQEQSNLTQLDAVVNHIHQHCENNHIAKLPDICLPALEKSIAFPDAAELGEANYEMSIDIGVYDDPENQYQGKYTIDLANQNVMIIGSALTGKTNVLQCIIRNLAMKYSPKEVNIYILDFASMVLKNFEKLHHVGGVVCASEDEKLKNLFKMINSEIETRKEKLVSVGVSSFSAYKEAGMTDLPQIVLMIDNLTALKELYFQDDDELLRICREGLSVGINIIIANAQTSGIGYRYLANFSEKIALFCNDTNEYGALFTHCSERIENIAGRCIVENENRHLECQTYLAFTGEKEFERVKEIRTFINQVNSKYMTLFARNIPVIPESLTEGYIKEQFAGYMQEPFQMVMGLDYASVTPFMINLSALGVCGISGKEQSGKHNLIKYMTNMLDSAYPENSELYIIDSISKKLSSLQRKSNVAFYSVIAEDAVNTILEMEAELKNRYDALVAGDETVLQNAKLQILILDSEDAVAAISNNMNALNAYKNIIGRYKNMKACILVSSFENANIPYSAPEIMKNIRDQHHMFFFDDLANLKVFDPPFALVRAFKKPVELGDCYYLKGNECVKLKTAKSLNLEG